MEKKMANKRRTLQPEFKAKAALAAIRGDKTISEIAKDFAIHPVQITQWKSQLLSNAASLFAKGRANQDHEEQKKKEEQYLLEIGNLHTQLEWLKKKVQLYGI